MLIVGGITMLIGLAAVTAYFVIKPEKPWMAFYILCAGGVIIVNCLVSLFLINKNLK